MIDVLKTEILRLECLQNFKRRRRVGGGGVRVLRISSDGDDRMGAKIRTPKKSLGPATKPKKSHAEFPSHKNFQKALNDVIIKIET